MFRSNVWLTRNGLFPGRTVRVTVRGNVFAPLGCEMTGDSTKSSSTPVSHAGAKDGSGRHRTYPSIGVPTRRCSRRLGDSNRTTFPVLLTQTLIELAPVPLVRV